MEPCKNAIIVEDASEFKVGDTVLIIQMKGAIIDSSNSANFGNIINYHTAGNYEFNYIRGVMGNKVLLKNILIRDYQIPEGKVQLVRVPYYNNATIDANLTCLPWDGRKGGILVLNVAHTLILQSDINVTGKGFRGGKGFNSNTPILNCFVDQYNIPPNFPNDAGFKGESIVNLGEDKLRGRGAPASGGGGGSGHNSGGGGGGNAGEGGYGGYQLNNCGNFPFENRGIPGKALSYSAAQNKIFRGGGGGAGNADNPQNLPPDGGNGGGIIIIMANELVNNGHKIIANGSDATKCTIPENLDCHDGMGGGGGGGTILFDINIYSDINNVLLNGGNGANMNGPMSAGKVGPGGGGGGGLLYLQSSNQPSNIHPTYNGGINGVLTQGSNDPYGTTAGANGITIFNLTIPFSVTPFFSGIDSVGIEYTTNCTLVDFEGIGYSQNSSNIVSYTWDFGDNTVSHTQNPLHNYPAPGTYSVKLVVGDVNGCSDSMNLDIEVIGVSANAGDDAD